MESLDLHLVWVGSPPNENVEESVANWSNGGNLNVILHTDFQYPSGITDKSFKKNAPLAQHADAIRLLPFKNASGWYADIDCFPGKKKLTRPQKSVFFRTDSRVLGNCFFYLSDNPEFYSLWAQEISKGLSLRNKDAAQTTGPGALTRAVYLYAFEFGLVKTRNDLALGSWQDFRHWPKQLSPRTKDGQIPGLFAGKLCTHIGESSWQKKEGVVPGIGLMVRQIIWFSRNSSLAFLLETIRALILGKIKFMDILSKHRFHHLQVIPIPYLDQEKIIWKNASPAKNEEQIRYLIGDLDVSTISTSAPTLIELLEKAGWKKIISDRSEVVFARPRLEKLLSSRYW